MSLGMVAVASMMRAHQILLARVGTPMTLVPPLRAAAAAAFSR